MLITIGLTSSIGSGKTSLADTVAKELKNDKKYIPLAVDLTKTVRTEISNIILSPEENIESNPIVQYMLLQGVTHKWHDIREKVYQIAALAPKDNVFVLITTRTPIDHIMYIMEISGFLNHDNFGPVINSVYKYMDNYYDFIYFVNGCFRDVPDKWAFLKDKAQDYYDNYTKILGNCNAEVISGGTPLEERCNIILKRIRSIEISGTTKADDLTNIHDFPYF